MREDPRGGCPSARSQRPLLPTATSVDGSPVLARYSMLGNYQGNCRGNRKRNGKGNGGPLRDPPFLNFVTSPVLSRLRVRAACISRVLDVVIHLKLMRVRAHTDGIDFVGALVVDPRFDQVGREDVALAEEVVIRFKRIERTVE